MTDWRTMMQGPTPPTKYPQNPQNRSGRSHSEDCEDIESRTKGPTPPKAASNPTTPAVDWLAEWRRLHELTHGLEPDDPRLPHVLNALDHCDAAFALGDVAAFRAVARHVERMVTEQPHQSRQASAEPPLQPCWIIAYRDRRNRLQDGTVSRCEWTRTGWTIHLLNGTTIPLRSVTSVAMVDHMGRTVAAWLTSRHGFNGERERGKP